MKILVFGKSGQVGRGLRKDLRDHESVIVLGRNDVDLVDTDAVSKAIAQHSLDIIINAAAYTAVDKAESETAIARAVNVDAPRAMAAAARATDALLIHYSTDYVFAGRAERPYRETDPVDPLGVYGRTKLDGELAIQDSGARHVILRTSWVYSNHGHNFLNTMLRLTRERKVLRVVDDQVGTPTFAGVLSRATAYLVDLVARNNGLSAGEMGLFHVTCTGQTTWCRFAQAIVEDAGISGVEVVPVTTSEYPTSAKRPAYSVLDTSKFTQTFAVVLPPWREALRECLQEGGQLLR